MGTTMTDSLTRRYLNDLAKETDDYNFMTKLQNAPGLLYGLDKIINRQTISYEMEEKVKEQLEPNNSENKDDESDDDADERDEHYPRNERNDRNERNERNERIDSIERNDRDERFDFNKSENNDAFFNSETTINKLPNYDDVIRRHKKLRKIKKRKARERENEKITFLSYLDRMREKGEHVRNLTVHDDYETIRYEALKLRKRRKMKFGKTMFVKLLLGTVKAIEVISTKIEIVNLHLEGWQRNVRYNLIEYDDVVEEIVEKYTKGGESSISPEAKLGLLLLWSAMEHSATNAGVSNRMGNLRGMFQTRVNEPHSQSHSQSQSNNDIDDDELLREIENEKKKLYN